jgi:hypothetical protein
MWADTLLDAERAHLLRLALWATASVLIGTTTIAVLRLRGRTSPLLFHCALQTAAWGAVDLLIVWAARGSLALRDFASARRLERFLWLNTGLDAGYVAVGLTLALAGWSMGRRLGAVGAGIGIIIQGLALLLLDLVIADQLARML